MCSKDLQSTTETEAMEVIYRENAMKPAVSVENGSIVVVNLSQATFPTQAMSLRESKLKNLIRSFRNLGQDGDREGGAAYEAKRKKQIKAENREYRVAMSYTTLISTVPATNQLKLVVTLLRNAARPAEFRHDPKKCFQKMGAEAVDAFMNFFVTQCATEMQVVFDKEYQWAMEHNERPNYLNPHVLDEKGRKLFDDVKAETNYANS